MKFYSCSVSVLFFLFTSLAQEVKAQLDTSANYSNFDSYINFQIKVVDFENSFYVNDFKTTEFQIENGFTYNIIKLIDFSFGINGGVILGILYEDRRAAYVQNTNNFSYDDFIKLEEIDWINKELSKTRYFIGFHPQLTFNISEKWKLRTGTELRYYFQPFFERRTFDGAHIINDGVNFDFLGNLALYYALNYHLSIGINYNRGLSHLHKALVGNSGGNGPFESNVRYHSLGLKISYSF